MIWNIAVLATLLAAVGSGASAASTQASIARARLEVRAVSNCTSPADLIARVASRTPRIQFVDDASAVGIQATFTVAPSGGVSAELVLLASGVRRTTRRFVTRSCAEAADAVALMVAVALDPVWVSEHGSAATGESGTSASPGRDSGASSTPQRTSTPTGGLAAQPPTKVQEQPLPPPQVPLPARTATDSTSTPALRGQPRIGVYLAGQSVWGPAPAVMPGVAVYAVVGLDRDTLWSPAIVLGAFHVWRSDLAEPGGSASFSLDAGSLDACALRVRVSIVDARACAAVLVGRLSAGGSDTDAPASVARLLAAAGGAGLFTVDLGSMVEVSARIGTGLTLRRDAYEFAATVFHTASRFTTSASIGVGLRLR